ncbi:MAG: hypothetical protein FJW34_11320 [Acidobacteria bacterium]|nr:hypothetical protein [Acidobacteriota bacterium]
MGSGEWRLAIQEALAGVAEAQAHLRTPTAEALESTWPNLERATGALHRLAECLRAAPAGGPEPHCALESLRQEVTRLRSLLEGAAALRLGWAQRLYATACGYTPQGQPAMPQVARRLSLQG